MKMLEGKNIIITGARRGIGKTTVEVFAANGANIWACARKYDEIFEADMADLSGKYGVIIQPVYFDTTDEAQIKNAIMEIRKTKRPIDALINIAGLVEDSTSFTMTAMEKMRKVFEVNFFGLTLLTQYVSRLMIRQNRGSIVNISSIAGIDGTPAQYEYASSKAAVIGGVRQLARELAQYNIRVNAVAPGIVDTEMGGHIKQELKDSVLASVMMGRVAQPEEISNVCMFLASDLSSYMTGQIIRVDGGM
ncbi:MAG: SDR family NAD(P)-dependent oxidoreductase [Lachnospiraceae bacterium]